MQASKWIIASVLAIGAITATGAQARVYFDVDVAPPPPRVEVVPAPRAGYVWAPGYWAYDGRRHVWHDGYWVHERHGHHWVPDRWDERGGHWHYSRGHWD